MPLSKIKTRLNKSVNLSPSFGIVTKITPTMIVATRLNPSIGDIVTISCDSGVNNLGIVVAIEEESFYISPFSFIEGHKCGDKVFLKKTGLNIGVGDALLGRVINPLGVSIDGKGEIETHHSVPITKPPIEAMKRGVIDEVFSVGVKAIDGLLTCGKGQKMGIFAGSGVGKSTLMGMIVRGSQAKIRIVALIGERGREVPEFIQKNLGGDLENTIIVVATSDDSPLMRKYGAFSAMAIAEYFKDRGEDVLFMMDSVTRFAMAQREIGLALGEPPTSKGYPPSVLALLPQLMERAGKEDGKGSITAFFTILVEGDDLGDPIADQSRSILDGHIVLSRELTDAGLYPPINILGSASRLSNDLVSKEHRDASRKFRRLYSLIKENELLIRLGSYQGGSDIELDEALAKRDFMQDFINQEEEETFDFSSSEDILKNIL